MHLKFKQLAISEVHEQTPNRVEFSTSHGILRIVVERHMQGWEVRLKITVNGVVVHDAEPTEVERQSAAKLFERVWDYDDAQRARGRAEAQREARACVYDIVA